MRSSLIILFLIWSLASVLSSNSLNRQCKNFKDCTFRNGHGDVILACENNKCQCKGVNTIFFNYKIEEVATECRVSKSDRCTVVRNPPCGFSDGINLVCGDPDKKCIDGKCIYGIKVLKTGENCDEDIECGEGLICGEPDYKTALNKKCQLK